MINLVLRSLHSVRQPLDDMVDVIGKDSAPVFDPRPGLCRVARPDCRRAIEVEQLTLLRWIQPPCEISRSLMIIGGPGAQVICSTGLF
jgi:hypothetical protein